MTVIGFSGRVDYFTQITHVFIGNTVRVIVVIVGKCKLFNKIEIEK